jgi:hypothetical protein
MRPYLEKYPTQKKGDWQRDLCSRAPACQASGPEFRLWYCQNEKKKKKKDLN